MKLIIVYIIILVLAVITNNNNNNNNFVQCQDIDPSTDNNIIEEEPNGIPINIQVLLIGFDSHGAYKYSLPSESLEKLLIESYPIHYVHSIFESDYLKSQNDDSSSDSKSRSTNNNNNNNNNNNRLLSHYDIKYNILSTTRISLDKYEQLLQVNMKPIFGSANSKNTFDGETHTISIDTVESYFEQEISKVNSGGGNGGDYTIIFINPSKDNIMVGRKLNNGDTTEISKFKYAYTIGEDQQQITSACWIGKSRYVVVDLSAGPLKYGTTLHKSSAEYFSEGSIDHDSIPRLIEYFLKDGYTGTSVQGASPIEIAAHISTLVISSIKLVFLPDTAYNYIPLFKKVLIPILIFKDTNGDGNTTSDHERVQDKYLNIDEIKLQTKKLFPFSEVKFVIAEHSIHEHKHISMAFSKSIKSHSSFEMDPSTFTFKSNVKSYLDSKELLLSLKTEDDILAAGLIGDDVTQLPINLINGGRGGGSSKNNAVSSQKTKILPIYVFTLLKDSTAYSGLLLDKYHSVASNQDAIIVLQTNHTYNSTFYKGNKPVQVNSLYSGTRNILAGLANSQGLLGPTLYYSEAHNRLVNNFLWSFGYHPFGLFNSPSSSTSSGSKIEISQIFIDSIIRNTIITGIQSTQSNLQLALNEITEFSSKYLVDSLGFEIQDITEYRGNFIIDRLYHTPPSKLPILKSITRRLHDDLDAITLEITNQIKSIPSFINNELSKQQKDKISQDLLLISTQVSGFLDYVHKEITNVETQLLCCAITKGRPNQSGIFSNGYLNTSIVIISILLSITVIVIINQHISGSSDKKKPLLLINRNRNRSSINKN